MTEENVIYLDRRVDFPYIEIDREVMSEVNQNITAGKRRVSLNELGQFFIDNGPGQILTATCLVTDRTLTPLKIDGENAVYISMDCLHEQARWYVTIHKDWAYYLVVVEDKAVFDRTIQTVNGLLASWKWDGS